MAHDPSKTEKATPKKREKSREEGNVAKSQELSKATTLLGGLAALYMFHGMIARELHDIFTWTCTEAFTFSLTSESVYMLFQSLAASLGTMLLPFMGVLFVVGFLTMRLQVGQLWTTKVFEPKWDKMFDVPKGVQRLLFDPKLFVRLAKSILQALAIGLAPYIVLRDEIPNLAPLFFSNPLGISEYMLSTGAKMTLYALVPMLVIGIGDTIYTFWDYEQNIKMSKQDVKDEFKQMEGDPHIRNKQREKMMNTMNSRMLKQVPEADVVICNPTHIAIALKYDAMQAPAPIVMAKGVDHMAEKIKKIARENDIPLRENKPLARALYKVVEVGDIIPEEMYQAVASILAQLHKYSRNTSR